MSGREEPRWPRIYLGALSPTERIYHGVDRDKSLVIRQNLFDYKVTTDDSYLSASSLVALALTEVCCRLGKGKVLMVPVMESLNLQKIKENRISGETPKLIWAYYRMPKLIYIPYKWSKKDQLNWMEMSHLNRLQTLNARAGGIMYKDVVMPMDLVYDAVERESFKFNAYADEHSGCRVMLAIVPKAFVGWYWQFQEHAIASELSGKDMNDGYGAWYVANEAALADIQVENAEQILAKLEVMFYTKGSGALMRFESLLQGMMAFHNQLMRVEKHVSLRRR